MKKINKIFLWAFVILSLLPLFEYTLFQWRNENRISITSNTDIEAINLDSNYITYTIPDEINSFTDYIIHENHYGLITGNTCNQTGLPKLLTLTTTKVLRSFYNKNNISSSGFYLQILTISLLLSRTLFIAVILLFTYITVLPVVFISDLLHRRLLK